MEIKDKRSFTLGIFIILVWIFFGIPTSWKIFLTILAGLYLIFISVKIDLPKRGSLKPIRRKGKITPVFSENSPMPKLDSVIAPVTSTESKESVKVEI